MQKIIKTNIMAKKVIKEYGGKEKYASKSAMMKHEKKEGKAFEKKEGKMMSKSSMKKCSCKK